jgi:hypothetical protein
MARGETLDALVAAYASLVKAGRGSLSAAYKFGNVVEALHGIYTYGHMADALSISASTLNKYAKLYRMYPTEAVLLSVSDRMSTYDVSKLTSSDAGTPLRYVYHCRNCGGTDVYRQTEKAGVTVPDTPAELLRQP